MHLITIFQVKKEVNMDLTFLEMGMDLTFLEVKMDLTFLKMGLILEKTIMELELLMFDSTDHHHLLNHNHHHSLRRHKMSIHLQRVCHQLHQAMKQLSQHRLQLCQSLFYNFPQHRITRLRLTKSHKQHLLRQRLHSLLSISRPLNL